MSSQHASQALLRPEQQGRLLDAFGGCEPLRAAVEAGVAGLRARDQEIAKLRTEAEERTRRSDYLGFQLRELDEARLDLDEAAAEENEHRASRERGAAPPGDAGGRDEPVRRSGGAGGARRRGPHGGGRAGRRGAGAARPRASARWRSGSARRTASSRISRAISSATPRAATPTRPASPSSTRGCESWSASSASTAARSPPPSSGARAAPRSWRRCGSSDERLDKLESERASELGASGARRREPLARRATRAALALGKAASAAVRELALPRARFEVALLPAAAPDGLPCGSGGRGDGGVPLQRERRRGAASAAQRGLGRRALARLPRAARRAARRGRRPRARVRRGRRRDRRRRRRARGRAARRALAAPPDPVHHAPAADRRARGPALLGREARCRPAAPCTSVRPLDAEGRVRRDRADGGRGGGRPRPRSTTPARCWTPPGRAPPPGRRRGRERPPGRFRPADPPPSVRSVTGRRAGFSRSAGYRGVGRPKGLARGGNHERGPERSRAADPCRRPGAAGRVDPCAPRLLRGPRAAGRPGLVGDRPRPRRRRRPRRADHQPRPRRDRLPARGRLLRPGPRQHQRHAAQRRARRSAPCSRTATRSRWASSSCASASPRRPREGGARALHAHPRDGRALARSAHPGLATDDPARRGHGGGDRVRPRAWG